MLRRTSFRLLGALAAAVVALPTAAIAQDGSATTVILVRHAEKVDASRDPDLSEAGRARAQELARVLADVSLDAIFATPFIRTRETARPTAERHGIAVRETPVSPAYPEEIAARIRAEHRGQTVLVVGHSNTTPEVIAALGIPDPPAIADPIYDDLFLVILPPRGPSRLLHLHYGRPTPRGL